MKKDNLDKRLLITTGILASFFAYLSVRNSVVKYLSFLEKPIFIFLLISTLFSFLFILLTAGSLKYGNKSRIFTLDISKDKRDLLYDLAVDSFILFPVISLFSYLTDYINNRYWHGTLANIFIYITVVTIVPTLIKLIWNISFKILGYIYKLHIRDNW